MKSAIRSLPHSLPSSSPISKKYHYPPVPCAKKKWGHPPARRIVPTSSWLRYAHRGSESPEASKRGQQLVRWHGDWEVCWHLKIEAWSTFVVKSCLRKNNLQKAIQKAILRYWIIAMSLVCRNWRDPNFFQVFSAEKSPPSILENKDLQVANWVKTLSDGLQFARG